MPRYAEELDRAEGFAEVFKLVKRSVKDMLDLERAGLSLYLADLPLNIGAYHEVGSNAIVMNRVLLNIVAERTESKTVFNAYIYSILLHEYIHSLGAIEEGQARKLVYEVSKRFFEEVHPAIRMATEGPLALIPKPVSPWERAPSQDVELVRDFDRSNQSYIA